MRRIILGVVLGLAIGSALPGCFDAPSAVVMFSCDPAIAPACPDGYTCEADGCCHRDGSDVPAHAGECQLQGGSEGATSLLPSTTSSSGTDTGASTSDATSTGTDASSSSTGAPTSTSSSDGSSSETGASSTSTTMG